MRLLAACLALWYAGCLLDELSNILLPGAPGWLDASLDMLRGAALVMAFPLLAHAIWKMLPPRARPSPSWPPTPRCGRSWTARPPWWPCPSSA